MAIDKLQMPNGQESVENIKFGLLEDNIDANFIKSNLDALNNEITKVNGDLSRLGIKLDDLKHIHQKMDGKRAKFGADFPISQMETLGKTIEQTEAIQSEKEASNSNSETGFSPEVVAQSDRSKISSTVDAYGAWRKFYTDSDLSDRGPKWKKINQQITDHLTKLKELKGLEIIQKGKLPENEEDHLIATIDNAQQLKNWHDSLGPQTQRDIAA